MKSTGVSEPPVAAVAPTRADAGTIPERVGPEGRWSFQTTLEAECLAADQPGATPWHVESDADPAQMWIRVSRDDAGTPAQGWKLHLSATLPSAEEVLRRALPIMRVERVSFKVAASPAALAALNGGEAGASQIGKFITIYPRDDAQAVRLAIALDTATRGLGGPAIPSDRSLAPGSLVHYRYGGFHGCYLRTPIGEIVPAIATPDGELVPDRRLTSYQPPAWVTDPFLAAGVAVEPVPPSRLIADRYLIVTTLHRSPRSAVYLALDTGATRRCVLKHARRDTAIGPDGHDARHRLRREAAMLARLAPDPRFPTPYELVEEDGDLYLAMEDVAGVTLEAEVMKLVSDGRLIAPRQVIAWGKEIAAALGAIHARGLVYRDLKSNNLIVASDGHIRIVDFELAHELGCHDPLAGVGTRGYMSPGQAAGAPPAIADDLYSLGAVLYFAATGVEPSLAPNFFMLLDRPLCLLNPTVGPLLAAIIACCLDHDPERRFPSMAALDEALTEAEGEPASPARGWGVPPVSGDAGDTADRYAMLARRLGETLRARAVRAPGGGLAWLSAHSGTAGLLSCDLNLGCAGTVLALAELAARFGEPRYRTVLVEGARWLEAAPRPGGYQAPGLYVGEAGIGAALLRAGQTLGDRAMIAGAEARGRHVATLPHRSPDLFNGSAGRLRFHLLLWDETAHGEHLEAALAAGEALLDTASIRTGSDASALEECCWVIPEGYDRMSGTASLGYAHGAAGIADALLDLHDVTGEARYLRPVLGAARWLARQAIPVADGGEDVLGLNWPSAEGEPAHGPLWCHGAAGIGRFFLHAAASGVFPAAEALATGAARAAARGAPWASPVQCHGLSGNIELLLDVFQWTGDNAYLTEALALARVLEGCAIERDGHLFWASESPSIVSPDYMVGYAGVAVCLLRLADPVRLPHQLSRAGFRR